MTRPEILYITHSEHASAGAVGAALERLGFALRRCCPMLGDALPRLNGGAVEGAVATVVLGGPQCLSELDQHPYLGTESAWLGAQVRAGGRVLGICLGAQLIAHALGGRVAPHPDCLAEIGYHPIEPIWAGHELIEQGFHAYQWHREGFELPAGAELLATGRVFPNQAYRLGETVYGVQFHP